MDISIREECHMNTRHYISKHIFYILNFIAIYFICTYNIHAATTLPHIEVKLGYTNYPSINTTIAPLHSSTSSAFSNIGKSNAATLDGELGISYQITPSLTVRADLEYHHRFLTKNTQPAFSNMPLNTASMNLYLDFSAPSK